MDLLKKAYEMKEELTKIRRHIHQNPELGFEEFKTTQLVKQKLEEYGVDIVDIGTKTGVLGILEGKKTGPGRVTALRADMDALPILEKTGLEYASRNEGIMHACGHDGHTTVLLGTAKLLSSMKSMFSGTVKFIFQPAEETLGGAKSMVEAGVLKNPDVDNILGIHGWPEVVVGKIGVWPGPYMASADKFVVKLMGSGGHGAYPHKANDTVLAASNAVLQFQNIVSRQIDALEKVVISVCTINGGKAFNVIPDEVTFGGTVRCHNNDVRMSIKEKMETILQGIAKSFGVKYELDYQWGIPPVVNDPEIINIVSKAAEIALGPNKVEQLKKPAMSSEDFSVYLQEVPRGAFVRLGLTEPGKTPLILHNEHFDFNDNALPIGVAVMAQYVLIQNTNQLER